MLVTRKTLVEVTDNFKAGDQLTIHVKDYGDFTATVQRVCGDEALVFFDDCITRSVMLRGVSDPKDFYKTELGRWLNTDLIALFPDDIRTLMVGVEDGKGLRVPFYGELWGHDDFYRQLSPDDCEQLELMKTRRNRVCSAPDDDYTWYWCINKYKGSFTGFCYCDINGSAYNAYEYYSGGVRPVFALKLPKQQ